MAVMTLQTRESGPPGLPAQYADAVKGYLKQAKAYNTRRMYGSYWDDFTAYCAARGLQALPAGVETVIVYLVDLVSAGKKTSTLQVALAAISFNHAKASRNPAKAPEVAALMTGIRRDIGTAQRQKEPAVMGDIRRMVKRLPDDLRGKRDRAILLVGFAGAFRRSELVGLTVADVRFNDTGMAITLQRSKTDQEGAGLQKHIPALRDRALCPVTALRAWLDSAGIESGVLFRPVDRWGHLHARAMDGREIARIVKARAKAAGIDARNWAGHSLRAGYVTTCVSAGVPTWAIREQTGHKSERAFERYIRDNGAGALTATKTAFGE